MRLLMCIASLIVALEVSAETEFWVSVGSFQDRSNAEEALTRANALLPDPFTVTPADTPYGYYYRILSGPYLVREVAEALRLEALGMGLAGAWLLAVESGSLSPLPLEYLNLDIPDIEPDTYDDALPPYEFDGRKRREERDPPRTLIDEAPADYKLHKLNRDQAWLNLANNPYLFASTGPLPDFAALAGIAPLPVAESSSMSVPADSPATGVQIEFQLGEPLILQEWSHEEAAIDIDGQLDEPAWQQAMAINEMKVTEPDLLTEPPYRTDVRLFYTDRGIYVSFDMEQPADTLIRRLSGRDDRSQGRDYVSFTLDTSGEGLYAYWMNLALGDSQADGTALPERQYSSNWDGAWYGATAQTDQGWSAEYFIPWSQMTMPKTEGARKFGFYSARQVAHLNQKWGWPAYPRSQSKFMSVLQPLQVRGVNPQQQWSFFPYASSTSDQVADDVSYKAGFDLFWRPSTNLQLTATANPDFGNVEADDVIVNLTAFETFFPEKRLFFLEGREIFQATPRANTRGRRDPVTLLNTRRIGSSPQVPADVEDVIGFPATETGQPTELYGAAKVTGQFGSLRYGVLTAFEENTNLLSDQGVRFIAQGRDYAVARFLYEDTSNGAYRALGTMSTLTAHPDSDASSHGIDYHYLSESGVWKFDGQFLYSNLDEEGEGAGGFVDIEYVPRMGLKHKFELAHYDDKLDINDLGFLRRNDVTSMRVSTEWIASGFESFRDFKVEPWLRYEENGEGEMVRGGIGGDAVFKLNNLSELKLAAKYFPKRYEDRNSFGNGTYRIEERPSIELGYSTDSSKKISYFVSTSWQADGVDGESARGSVGIFWRPVDQLNIELSTSYRNRDGWLLHQEDRNMTAFDAEEWKPKLNMGYFFTAKHQFNIALQWVGIKAFEDKFYLVPASSGDLIEVAKPDGGSDDFTISQMNFQLRYRWQIAPLSDLFVVYTRNGFEDPPSANFGELFHEAWEDPTSEQLVVKLRYRLGT